MEKVLITGGTGFIGSYLVPFLNSKAYKLALLSRKSHSSDLPNINYHCWDIQKKEIDPEALRDVDIIINMAGANIGSERWTKKRKQLILNSRVESTNFLYESIAKSGSQVKCVVSSSAVGYYGTFNSDKILTEESPNGNDFVAEVCRQWEEQALKFENLGARVVFLRKGVVLGKGGGMYQRLSAFSKYGINTSVGDGKQYIPWISINDLMELYGFVLEHTRMTGAYNAVSGDHVNMNELASALSRSLKMPILTPNAPAFVMKILYGELSDILLNGSRASNEKLQKAGFEFRHSDLQKVLDGIAGK